MTDLDKLVMEARYRYRIAYREWERHKGDADTEKRVKVEEELQAAERAYLAIGRRWR